MTKEQILEEITIKGEAFGGTVEQFDLLKLASYLATLEERIEGLENHQNVLSKYCGCGCHTPTKNKDVTEILRDTVRDFVIPYFEKELKDTTPTEVKDWEKEFDKRFETLLTWDEDDVTDDVKQFIRNLLNKCPTPH